MKVLDQLEALQKWGGRVEFDEMLCLFFPEGRINSGNVKYVEEQYEEMLTNKLNWYCNLDKEIKYLVHIGIQKHIEILEEE